MLRALPFVMALTGCTFYVTGSGSSGDAGGSGFDTQIEPDAQLTDDAPDAVSPPLADAAIDSPSLPFDSFINLDGLIPPFDVIIPPLPDAPSPGTLVETMTVPCNGQVVVSQTTFSSASQYRVLASGTCKVDNFFGNDVFADAEYFGTTVPRNRENGVDVGIGLYDTTLGFDKEPDWGFYDASHVYEVKGPGFDVPLTARFHDKANNAYGDNVGSLTLQIYLQ